ncbi:biotin/lipoyl-binding protein [Anaerolineae bacterium CFX9]|nr:biotin/lipoyl-binding protein [Anaerolineae bacterium CFX9]
MIRKILIANRGEIACRIIRTCRELGIFSVAVYSDADAHALHVMMADEAFYLGGAPAAQSYLNIERLLEAAQRTGADAVHPGFGFLAENSAFAQAVIDAGLTWIGPTPAAMDAMGDKRRAKLMLTDIPLVPGYSGDDQSDEALIAAADEIGFPIMVKAAAGGGGKGMRQVRHRDELPAAIGGARREAQQAFGDGTLLLEKYVDTPRHVEVQIFGDQFGRVVALGERECSIQRRHQKVIEETPSPAVDPELRQRMCDAAIRIGQQIGYVSAGTVEFILDAERNFYFLEMNTRLQVEHPVTEMVSGFDLVAWQIRVAEGASIDDLLDGAADPMDYLDGHAIEVRVYAEDPSNGFLPVTGDILLWRAPEGVRVDSGIQTGDTISVHYDPMIAKVIAHGSTRHEAISRLDYALGKLVLLGLTNNVGFLRRTLMESEFLAGAIDTGYIERHPELLESGAELTPQALLGVTLAQAQAAAGENLIPASGWRNSPYRPQRATFTCGETDHVVEYTPQGGGSYQIAIDGTPAHAWASRLSAHDWMITVNGHRQHLTIAAGEHDDWWAHSPSGSHRLRWKTPLPAVSSSRESAGSLRSPMPGQVIRVEVEIGQQVSKGDVLLILEAMKMEHRIKAPAAGTVRAIYYGVGQSVQAGVKLLDLEASD